MKPILEIQNISKKFMINHEQQPYLSIRDSVSSLFKTNNNKQEFWALKHVSFTVEPGDSIGIIGKNGAGKSTLLKILSKITPPTSGKIISRGRIASLLEVGTGFHPELSGRENVFMNGSILGMTKVEILKNFDAIVDFAGISKFIDTPLKHYSSGMQLRLAFAVAAFLENEILVIDEVLAVGDAEFQKKCMGKMDNISKSGRTILFVSHNIGAVQNLCNKGVVMQNGKLVTLGSIDSCINSYASINEVDMTTSLLARTDRQGNGVIKISNITVANENLKPIDSVFSGQNINIMFEFKNYAKSIDTDILDNIIISIQLHNNQDVPIFLHHNRIIKKRFDVKSETGTFIATIKNIPLPQSSYFISFSVIQNGVIIDMINKAYKLEVLEGDYFGFGEVPPASHGISLVNVDWSLIQS